MPLITDAKDEELAMTRCPVCGSETANDNQSKVNVRLRLALAAKESAEAALCRAMEALENARRFIARDISNTEIPVYEEICTALSSSAPCRHEAESTAALESMDRLAETNKLLQIERDELRTSLSTAEADAARLREAGRWVCGSILGEWANGFNDAGSIVDEYRRRTAK